MPHSEVLELWLQHIQTITWNIRRRRIKVDISVLTGGGGELLLIEMQRVTEEDEFSLSILNLRCLLAFPSRDVN